MRREAARTLYSLSPAYQQHVRPHMYQVIAIDNGSTEPLEPADVHAMGPNFIYRYLDTSSVSPAGAVNTGVAMAEADLIGVIVDGARLATPGLVVNTLRATHIFDTPLIGTLSWHLGPEVQNLSIQTGYGQTQEDRLLNEIDWPKNGYDLFRIATLAQSSHLGYSGGVPPELSWLALRKSEFEALGGYDTRFESPGGGLVNHHFRDRALSELAVQPVMLLGEGVFHQIHGGVATNVPMERHPIREYKTEYRKICGREYITVPAPNPYLMGVLPQNARRFLATEPTEISE